VAEISLDELKKKNTQTRITRYSVLRIVRYWTNWQEVRIPCNNSSAILMLQTNMFRQSNLQTGTIEVRVVRAICLRLSWVLKKYLKRISTLQAINTLVVINRRWTYDFDWYTIILHWSNASRDWVLSQLYLTYHKNVECECRNSALKLVHDCFLPNSFQFITIHLSPYYRRCIVYLMKGIVK
jgi:hypothetical protein